MLGVDSAITHRGRSSSLLDMRRNRSNLRPPKCEVQNKRISVGIPPSQSSVQLEPAQANSANISVTVTAVT